ncbi:hypothetical protein SUNI508_07171 [Seiridium unicorne]|uniref:Uncharacterized protein n=1 Tax=Seiridium unicorne TaxID=138068 RepID=A0ABR2UZL8_9PEZI
MAESPKVNLDWLRNPPPTNLTPFQKFTRDVRWENTSIGPMEAWPRELKQVVRLLIADTSPRVVYWGDKFTSIYNEAYIPLVGSKHPWMQGRDAQDVFPHFWSNFSKLITEKQCVTGETLSGDATMMLLDRAGFLEECYFDWKLIPILSDDDGQVMGSYGCPSDMTQHVIGLRRFNCIKHLSQRIQKVSSLNELWAATLAGLDADDKDVPFTLLYSVVEQTSLAAPPSSPHYTCRLEGSVGVDADHALAKMYLDVQDDLDGFAPRVLEALKTDECLVLKASDINLQKLLDGVGWRGHGLPSHEFVIVPLRADDETVAFFIIGLNPYRRYNKFYQDFLHSIAEVVTPQITRIKMTDEVKRRAEIAYKATSDFRKSEERFARFAERSTIGLAVAGLDRHITYANDAWYRFAGLDPKSTDYDGWLDSVFEEDLPLVIEWWQKVLINKKGGQFQYRSKIPFRQGNMYSDNRTAICAVYPDLNEAQEIESVMGLVIDISELKWIEEQLRVRTKALEESESKWKNYAEHCPLGIVRTDGTGQVQYGNDAWHAYYGFTRGEVPGPQPWLSYVEESYLEDWKECFESFQKSPGPRTHELKLKNKVYTVEEGGHAIENGVYILVTGFSEFNEDGTVDYIDFWVTGDISPQKMAAKILADKMDEAIRLKTHQERFIDMISHEIRNPLSAVLHCGEEIVAATKTCLKHTRALPFDVSETNDEGNNVVLQQLQNALDAANTIMYCVQHQKQIVDDVLTLSKLDADLLVVSPVPVQPMSLVQTALKVFSPELKMTDITLSVIEDPSLSALDINWVLLDPNRFLQIVINLVTNAIKFTRTAPTRNIDITVSAFLEPPSDTTIGVQYVPRRYEPAKPNSPAGDLLREFHVSGEVYLCFSVRDTGKGLTADERALLFNRFEQASPKTHIEYGGSGLGLFISRQITEMLGGEIGMCSGGIGSTFAFYVKSFKTSPPRRPSISIEPILQMTRTLSLTSTTSPLVVPPSPEDKSGAPIDLTLVAPNPEIDSTANERHVLVVEDNLVNQKVLCKLLRNRGFLVNAANHGQEALGAIRALREESTGRMFDAILCDIEMPIMGGIEFSKEVRSQESSGHMPGHVPIIGVTANVRSQQVTAAIEAGMDGVTTKPYRIDDLIANIDRICSTTTTAGR